MLASTRLTSNPDEEFRQVAEIFKASPGALSLRDLRNTDLAAETVRGFELYQEAMQHEEIFKGEGLRLREELAAAIKANPDLVAQFVAQGLTPEQAADNYIKPLEAFSYRMALEGRELTGTLQKLAIATGMREDPAATFEQPLNPDVDLDQQVPVIDLSNVKGLRLNRDGEREFLKQWVGANLVLPTRTADGDVKADLTSTKGKHAFWSSQKKGVASAARLKSLAVLDQVLAGAARIETLPPKHQGVDKTHRFYAPVMVNGQLSTLRFVVHEMAGKNPKIEGVELYDIIKETPSATQAPGGAGNSSGGALSVKIREMLYKVKDSQGVDYAQFAQRIVEAINDNGPTETSEVSGPPAVTEFNQVYDLPALL